MLAATTHTDPTAFLLMLAAIGLLFTFLAAVAEVQERRQRRRIRDMHRRDRTGPYATPPEPQRWTHTPSNPRKPW